jgi:hypothetical protein
MDFNFLVHFVERLGEALKGWERLGGGTAYLDDLVLALTNSFVWASTCVIQGQQLESSP